MSGWFIILFAIAGGIAPLQAGTRSDARLQEDLRRALGILSYLVADYPEAVDDAGRVFDTDEHEEHLELLESADALLKPAPRARAHGILRDLDAIHRDVVAHRAPARVCERLRDLQGKILKVYDVRIEPEQVPALPVGKILYAQSCAICHGDDGRANTMQAGTLDPAPRDFLSPKLDGTLSPYSAFHMITFGIPGTGMASYETLSDEERWCLAFYVLSLRHPLADGAASAASAPGASVPDLSVRDLAHATDADLRALLAALPEAARETQLARWRRSLPLRVAD